MDTKAFKRSLQHSEITITKGFGPAKLPVCCSRQYQSNLNSGNSGQQPLQHGDVTIRLAEAFGFEGDWTCSCNGMKPTAFSYQRMDYQMRLFIVLLWISICRICRWSLSKLSKVRKDFSVVGSGDVVIHTIRLPTFKKCNCLKIRLHDCDTTCPWVSKVWNTVEAQKNGDTSIIHGKYKHEETLLQVRLPLSIWWLWI